MLKEPAVRKAHAVNTPLSADDRSHSLGLRKQKLLFIGRANELCSMNGLRIN